MIIKDNISIHQRDGIIDNQARIGDFETQRVLQNSSVYLRFCNEQHMNGKILYRYRM